MNEVFSKNLKRFRNTNKITQQELADEFEDIGRSAIGLWESGRALPSTENLVHLSYIFDVSVDALLKDPNAESTAHLKKITMDDFVKILLAIESSDGLKTSFRGDELQAGEKAEMFWTVNSLLENGSEDSLRQLSYMGIDVVNIHGANDAKIKTKRKARSKKTGSATGKSRAKAVRKN